MKRHRRVAGRVLAELAMHHDSNRPASVQPRMRRHHLGATAFNHSSALRKSRFRLAVSGCVPAPSDWICRRRRRSGCDCAFALVCSASFGGSLAARCPAVQAFAHPCRIYRHSGGFQFFRQLLAAPAFAVQCQYPLAQRFQQVNGGFPIFRRLALRQLFQFFVQCRVIQFRGDLSVINAFAHNVNPVPFMANDSASWCSCRAAVARFSTGKLTV